MEDFKEFNPEINVSMDDASNLAAVMSHPGFKVIQKISRACVDTFVGNWLNQETDEGVLRTHQYAKVAAMLYTMQLNRMKSIVDDFTHSQPSDTPVDVAAALDIGEFTPYGEDVVEEPLF